MPRRLAVLLPAEPERLLDVDEEAFRASDERMPYYATLWPAGRALAAHLLTGPPLPGLRVLDLGCGAGAAGLAAARRQARVVFLDWAPGALALVARAARMQGLAVEALVEADWREPPSGLGTFDRIVGADLLYEARNVAPVAAFLAAHLAGAGEGWLADPGRDAAGTFPWHAARAGLDAQVVALPPTEPGAPACAAFRVAPAPRR